MTKQYLIQYKHLFAEGGWVFLGQATVAVISLVGLRILTEIAAPNILGGATLLLGALTLLRNIFIAPIGNTQIRYHPEYVTSGIAKWFDDNMKRLYSRFIIISVLLFVIIFVLWSFISSYALNFLLLLILVLYFILDAMKGYKINRLSAERRQKFAAIWQISDALLVNILFIAALLLVNNMESYLAGQSVGLLIGLVIFGFISYPKIENRQKRNPNFSEIKSKIIHYGLPFIPLAIVSWVSNLGDRYIIGNYLSLSEVGIYTAVYSIASRPFIMVGGILSGFFRPILFQHSSQKDYEKADKTFKYWISVALIVFILGFILLYTEGRFIMSLLLAKTYANKSLNIYFIIGIAYIIFNLTQILENRIFSYGTSLKIILPTSLNAISNIIFNIILIPAMGILGAAFATLGSFTIQLIAITFILQVHKNDH